MRGLLAGALLFIAAALAHAADNGSAAYLHSAQPFSKHNVVLLQSSALLESRVSSVDAMAEYIRALETAANEALLAGPSKRPAAGFIVIALRPGPKSRVWLDFDAPAPSFETSRALVDRLGAVPPFEVRDGPVVFALKVGLWGAFESKRLAPSPAEWKAATRKAGKQLELDALIEQVWRD